ncbi:hypothetical protein M885DRAFT_562666 [Pelagophyceae sp. CCMP2097]|nr:hypothetical protein M885DRAFT_562666 [Pelagophyceae sp. CCMP2097]
MAAPATAFTAALGALATVRRTHAAHASALCALERAFDAEMALLAKDREALQDDRVALMRQVDEKLARGEATLEEKRAARIKLNVAAEDAPPRDSANSTSATKMGQKRLKTEASQKRNILVLGMVDVTDLQNFFKELNAEDVLIDEIVLDYYRFPAVYMLEAYKHIPGFLSSVAARCAPEATVIVPVLRRPDGGEQRAFLYWPAAEPEELSAQDVPLAAWSSHLDTDECLGGIPNAEQLALLREDTPFDRLRLPMTALMQYNHR